MEDNTNTMDAFSGSLNFGSYDPFGAPEEIIFGDEDTIPEGETVEAEEQPAEQDNITEEEVPENVGDGEGDDTGGDDNGSSSNLYSSLASVLSEQGLLPSVDITTKPITTVDEFAETMRQEQIAQAKIMLDDYISNLDINSIVDSKRVLDSISNIDQDYLANNIEVAKDLLRQDYKAQGFSDDRVERIINRFVDLGEDDLISEALTAVDSLKQVESQKIEDQKLNIEREKAENIRQNQELQERLKTTVFKDDLITGYSPTPVLKDKVYKTMTEVVGTDEHGNPQNRFLHDRAQDPVDFEARMYFMYELTNGFKDLGKLGATSKSRAVSELEKAARSTIIIDNSKPSFATDKESYFANGNFKLNI